MIDRAFEGRDITVSVNGHEIAPFDTVEGSDYSLYFDDFGGRIVGEVVFSPLRARSERRRPPFFPRKDWLSLPRGERTAWNAFYKRIWRRMRVALATSKPFKD